jgi:serine/threonine protein kinase
MVPVKHCTSLIHQVASQALQSHILRPSVVTFFKAFFLGYCRRDVKPENLLVRPDQAGGLRLRLIDFGSAIDGHSLRHLYGSAGASEREQTMAYAPPEAVLGRQARCVRLFWRPMHPPEAVLGKRALLPDLALYATPRGRAGQACAVA